MNARKALIAVSVLSTVALTSCGTVRRAGKDLFLGIGTPVLAIYGGSTDGVVSAKSVRSGLDSGPAVEVLAFPFTFAYHAFEHTIYGIVHLLDFFAFPFYGLAELAPNGPKITPLDFYTGTWFDRPSDRSGTDAQTGEQIPRDSDK
ncbi:MAG: hypothetical protein ABIP94_03915 [Planctomycetota bacterium]